MTHSRAHVRLLEVSEHLGGNGRRAGMSPIVVNVWKSRNSGGNHSISARPKLADKNEPPAQDKANGIERSTGLESLSSPVSPGNTRCQ